MNRSECIISHYLLPNRLLKNDIKRLHLVFSFSPRKINMNFSDRQNYCVRRYILAIGMTLLTVIYFLGYLHNPARPSPSAPFPEGWWGWFDQSKYLQSAQALAHLDLSPSSHWYPLGYAILGAPFVWMGNHVYLIPALLCLLITAGGLVF